MQNACDYLSIYIFVFSVGARCLCAVLCSMKRKSLVIFFIIIMGDHKEVMTLERESK